MSLALVSGKRAGRPTERDARRKSEAVLEVATDLFVARGFNGTTMEAVAQTADIGKQALYQRYPDKDSLFSAVIDRLKDDEAFHPPSVPDDAPASAGLRLWLGAILADCARPKSVIICKLVMREGHRFPLLPPFMTDLALERFVVPLAGFIDGRRRAGEIRKIEPMAVAAMCVDLIFAEITRAMFRDTPLTPDEIAGAADRIADLAFRGLALPENAGA